MGFLNIRNGICGRCNGNYGAERQGVGNFLALAGSKNNWRFKWIYPNSIHKGQENQSACAIGYVNSQRTHVIYVTKLSLSGVPPHFSSVEILIWSDIHTIYLCLPYIHVRPCLLHDAVTGFENGLIFSFYSFTNTKGNHSIDTVLQFSKKYN